MLAEVAVQLDVSPEQVKEANLYQYGQTNPFNVPITPCYTREIWTKLKEATRFDDQTVEIAKFNSVCLSGYLWRATEAMSAKHYLFHYIHKTYLYYNKSRVWSHGLT